MKNYLINTTVITYIYDINELEVLDHVLTIKEVKEELQYLRKINDIRAEETRTHHIQVHASKYKNLSGVDLSLLQTAKRRGFVLVTDDTKLEKAARSEGVRVLDTPRLILAFSFDTIITGEKAKEILGSLTFFYNRIHSIKRALKHLEEWR